MIPAVSDVNNLTRAHLGDTEVPSGQIFQDNFLQPYLSSAYESLYTWLERNGGSKLRRTKYFNLPANTAYISPDAMGITSMGNPINIYDRKLGVALPSTVGAITPISPATGGIPSIDLTCANHGLQVGAEVVTFGFVDGTITDSINNLWYIAVPDANTIRLNGAEAADGDVTGCAGIVSTGAEDWPDRPLQQLASFSGQYRNAVQNSCLSQWQWERSIFRFAPANAARQIKIIYELSGFAPTQGSVGLDDSLNALAAMTAALAARAKGFASKAQSLFVAALGNAAGDTTNIRGGYFYEMAQIDARQSQMTRTVVARYRRRRNTGPTAFSW